MKYKIPSLFILLFLLASCSPATDPNKDTFDCYYETYNITVNLKNNDNYQKLLGLTNKSKHISDNDELSQFNKSVQSFFSNYPYYSLLYRKNLPSDSSLVILVDEYKNTCNIDKEISSVVYKSNRLNIWSNTLTSSEESVNSVYAFTYVLLNSSKKKPTIKYTDKVSESDDFIDDVITLKPIIYFYPTQEMDLEIKYYDPNRLLTTYPKYEDGWNIHLKENGLFTNNNSDSNREYYGLYFDEINEYKCDFDEGFYVNKDNAIEFLEEKLDYLGYNNKEADEFIMYWLPILENNVHSLVYFEQTEERNNECPLSFSVSPDSILRTIIHIKKVDKETSIKEQQLYSFNRFGFSVVEWGGSIIK